jgi:hypothetical protein
VLFTSGIQHYAEIPEGMEKMPDYVKSFLKKVPSVWDDVRFVDGHPGKYAVMARQGAGRWYVAGINAEDSDKTLELDLGDLPGASGAGVLIADGDDDGFDRRSVKLQPGGKLVISLRPRGGFVFVFE